MKIANPATITWSAPTTKVDGTPIDYALDYELAISETATPPDAALMSMVGNLQPDKKFIAPVALAEHKDNVEYHLFMRAIDHDQPTVKSAWAAAGDTIIFLSPPNPPLDFTVA